MSEPISWKSRIKDWLSTSKETVTEEELQKMADVLKADYQATVEADANRTNTPRTSTVEDTLAQGRGQNQIEAEARDLLAPSLDRDAERFTRARGAKVDQNIKAHGAYTSNLTNSTKDIIGGSLMDGQRLAIGSKDRTVDVEADYRSGRDDKYLQAIMGDQAIKRQALETQMAMANQQRTMDFISKLGLGALMLAG